MANDERVSGQSPPTTSNMLWQEQNVQLIRNIIHAGWKRERTMFGPTSLHSTATLIAFALSSSANILHMPLLSNETPARLTLQTFHKDFGERKVELTASVVNSEPWFRAKEVAAALGFKYVRSAIETHVDEEDLTTMKALGLMTAHESRSHACEGVYISANGLCSLVIGSRKSDAKAIGRWVL